MAQRAAERVARPEAAHHLDRRRLEQSLGLLGGEQHAVAAELDDRELDALRPQPRRGLAWVVGTDRDRALLPVPDRDRRVVDGGTDPRRRLLARAPERRPVVQVEHRVAPARAGLEHPLGRRRARFLRQRARRHPQDRHVGDGRGVDVARAELEVRDRRVAAEQQLRILGRIEHGERERRDRAGLNPDEPRVDAEVAQLGDRDLAPWVLADLGEHRGVVAEARGGDRDVRRAAADRLPEALRRVPIRADLLAIQVDADPSDGQQLEIARHP